TSIQLYMWLIWASAYSISSSGYRTYVLLSIHRLDDACQHYFRDNQHIVQPFDRRMYGLVQQDQTAVVKAVYRWYHHLVMCVYLGFSQTYRLRDSYYIGCLSTATAILRFLY